MNELPKVQYLFRRDGHNYYRRRVPKELVDIVGKREFKVSLGTSDLRVIREKIALENLKVEETFSDARRKLLSGSKTEIKYSPPQLSHIDIERMALLWFKELEKQEEERFLSTQSTLSSEDRELRVDALLDDLSALESGDEALYLSALQPVSKKIQKKKGVNLNPSSEESKQLDSFVHRGLIQHTYNSLERYKYEIFSRHVPDTLFDKVKVVERLKSSNDVNSSEIVSWGELIKLFIEAQVSDGKKAKTTDGYRLAFNFSTEFFGHNRNVTEITSRDCRNLRDKLVKLPSNAKKRFPHLTLLQAAEILSEGDTRRLNTTTVNTQIRKLTTVFNFAVREGFIDKNPASNLQKLKPKQREKINRRPFTINELNVIFSRPLYTGCIDDKRNYNKPGPNKPRGYRFWVPLLSLYTGMRLDECCHLFTDDVKVIDGVPVIHVRVDENDEKSIKTEQSERIVPIHPFLQELGFVEYAESAKANLQKLLFADIPKSASGSYSANVSKWFANFLNLSGIKQKGICFHSFRHTFRDAARENDLDREAIAAIGGWKDSDDVMDAYGKGHSARRLYDEIRKIEYRGLSLEHL